MLTFSKEAFLTKKCLEPDYSNIPGVNKLYFKREQIKTLIKSYNPDVHIMPILWTFLGGACGPKVNFKRLNFKDFQQRYTSTFLPIDCLPLTLCHTRQFTGNQVQAISMKNIHLHLMLENKTLLDKYCCACQSTPVACTVVSCL